MNSMSKPYQLLLLVLQGYECLESRAVWGVQAVPLMKEVERKRIWALLVMDPGVPWDSVF